MDLMTSVMLILKGLSNDELAAGNNAINGFGKMASSNLVFAKFKRLSLIREDGRPLPDCLGECLSREVNRRVAEGSFN